MSGDEPRTPFSLHARSRSFLFAFRGIAYLARSEHNAWIHLVATIVALVSGLRFKIGLAEWRWIALAVALVWLAEAFNTAIERVADVASPAHNRLIGQAKDVAAGGVLIAALFAIVIAATVFLPYLAA